MGKIILNEEFGGNYEYIIPSIPKDETEILFYDRKKSDQFWDYKVLSKNELSKFDEQQKRDYITKERYRFFNGCWFFNNGVPTYITGMHYDHLVNSTFSFGKAKYFDTQRFDFYFRDFCDKDIHCKGMVWLKPRRAGITAEEITAAQYYVIRKANQEVGLMSDILGKCLKTLHRPIVDSFIKRPYWIKPKFRTANGKLPRNSPLEFTPETLEELESGEWLGGNIAPYQTTEKAMDGEKKHYIVQDEMFKWVKTNPKQTLETNIKCLPFGIGKISVLGTMGDADSQKQAIEEGIKLWHDSNPLKINENGFTASFLYRYFISAIHNKEEIPTEFTDKYGFVDQERAMKFLLNDRKRLDPQTKEYLYAVRKNPLSPQEAVATMESTKIFSTGSINAALDILNALPFDEKPYVRGFLNEDSSGIVNFTPDFNGFWKIKILPGSDLRVENLKRDLSNRCTLRGGYWNPPTQSEFGCGYDPKRMGDIVKGGKSSSSIVVAKKYDLFGNGKSGQIAAIFDHTFDDPEFAHHEVFKACKFWGMQCTHERNVETVQPYFQKLGAIGLLRLHDHPTKRGLWTHGNGKVVNNGLNYIQGRLKRNPESNIDPYQEISFEELLLEYLGFDPQNTTKFNLTMAQIMCEYELTKMLPSNIVDDGNLFKNFSDHF